MDNFYERLSSFIAYTGLSYNKFAERIGTSAGQISQMVTYRKKFGVDKLINIFNNFSELNPNWLMKGEGEMIISNKKSLGTKDQLSPMRVLTVTIDDSGEENIAFVPVKARAGYTNGFDDPVFIEELQTYHFPGFRNGTYRLFEIDGYSMLPTFEDGDMVVGQYMESLDDIRDGRVHVIVTDEDVLIKRLFNRIDESGTIVLKSDNSNGDYPAILLEPESIKEVWYASGRFTKHMPPPGSVEERLNQLEGFVAEISRQLN